MAMHPYQTVISMSHVLGCSLEVGEFILRPLKIAFVLKTEGVMDVNVTVDGELYPSCKYYRVKSMYIRTCLEADIL